MFISMSKLPSSGICSTVHKGVIVCPNIIKLNDQYNINKMENITNCQCQSLHCLSCTETCNDQQTAVPYADPSFDQMHSVSEDEQGSVTEDVEFGSLTTVICSRKVSSLETDNESNVTSLTQSTDLEKYMNCSVEFSSPDELQTTVNTNLVATPSSRSEEASTETIVNTESDPTPCASAMAEFIEYSVEVKEEGGGLDANSIPIAKLGTKESQRAVSVDSYLKVLKTCARNLFGKKSQSEPSHSDLIHMTIVGDRNLVRDSVVTENTTEIERSSIELEFAESSLKSEPQQSRQNTDCSIDSYTNIVSGEPLRRNSFTLDRPSSALITSHSSPDLHSTDTKSTHESVSGSKCSAEQSLMTKQSSDQNTLYSSPEIPNKKGKRLVRSNSYTLDHPSPALIRAHEDCDCHYTSGNDSPLSMTPKKTVCNGAFKKEKVHIPLLFSPDRGKFFPELRSSKDSDCGSCVSLKRESETSIGWLQRNRESSQISSENKEQTSKDDSDVEKDKVISKEDNLEVAQSNAESPSQESSEDVQSFVMRIFQEMQEDRKIRETQLRESQNRQWIQLHEEFKEQERELCARLNALGVLSLHDVSSPEGTIPPFSQVVNCDNSTSSTDPTTYPNTSNYSLTSASSKEEVLSQETLSQGQSSATNSLNPTSNPVVVASYCLKPDTDSTLSNGESVQTSSLFSSKSDIPPHVETDENLKCKAPESVLIKSHVGVATENGTVMTENFNANLGNRFAFGETDLSDTLTAESFPVHIAPTSYQSYSVSYCSGETIQTPDYLSTEGYFMSFRKSPSESHVSADGDIFRYKKCDNISVGDFLQSVPCTASVNHNPAYEVSSLGETRSDIRDVVETARQTITDKGNVQQDLSLFRFSTNATKKNCDLHKSAPTLTEDEVHEEKDVIFSSVSAANDLEDNGLPLSGDKYEDSGEDVFYNSEDVPSSEKTDLQESGSLKIDKPSRFTIEQKLPDLFSHAIKKARGKSASFVQSNKKKWAELAQVPIIRERLAAFVKGYLTRRLMKTEKVQELKTQLLDTIVLVGNLGNELTLKGNSISKEDVELHNKLIVQFMSIYENMYNIFCTISVKERMEIIADSRKKRLMKMTQASAFPAFSDVFAASAVSKKSRISAATVKSLERKRSKPSVQSKSYTIEQTRRSKLRFQRSTSSKSAPPSPSPRKKPATSLNKNRKTVTLRKPHPWK